MIAMLKCPLFTEGKHSEQEQEHSTPDFCVIFSFGFSRKHEKRFKMVRIFLKKLQTFFEMQYILQHEHVLEKVNILQILNIVLQTRNLF